jgi:hypothetical protein
VPTLTQIGNAVIAAVAVDVIYLVWPHAVHIEPHKAMGSILPPIDANTHIAGLCVPGSARPFWGGGGLDLDSIRAQAAGLVDADGRRPLQAEGDPPASSTLDVSFSILSLIGGWTRRPADCS